MKNILDALRETEKIYRVNLTRITKNNGITIAEWQLLMQVAAGFDTQDKLAKAMALDNSTLSRQLSSLYKKQLVTNTAIGHDKRQLVYEVTDLGKQTLTAVTDAHEQFETSLFQLWDPEEERMLQILLNRLEKSLSKVRTQANYLQK
ncbi:transcriptional regulator [Weissella oryzae SG25]|uniref:Transcriptional regulator n=1 Tax=Weissella oryzae (strain DSM 25784 / JCM 18191 / LMG 30913 / SG25) TaxID=1329250 RepID=A0A069CSH1_WEIOS|nr:MarR family winged helix-turn-helix transcriptional regulator [Weissella oryzae]GAK30322.1 transcriptional regulator [Weissella oryzae SG25]